MSCLRNSLVALWWLTAAASASEWHGQSHALLKSSGLPPGWQDALIAGGIVADLLVGWVLWRFPGRAGLRLAMAQVLLFTVLATVLAPAQWLHPLGPLTKNLVVLAALRHLERSV